MRILFVFLIIQLLCTVAYSNGWHEVNFQNTTIYNYIPELNKFEKNALMVNLHGCRQNSSSMKNEGNWEEPAENWGMVVTVPEAPDGGVYVGCWDYFGKKQNVKKSHIKYLISWIEKLLEDKELNIDPKQVYISGFSSGAAMSMVISCLRPDLIAGVGVNSGPSIGTKFYESSFPATDANEASALCQKWAGDKKLHLKTQVASIVNGNRDLVVDIKYNVINAEMYGILTDRSLLKTEVDINSISGERKEGRAYIWTDDF